MILRCDDAEIGAEFAERDFGVIARRHRLADGGLALGEESGEQHARLHLRAGHGQRVIDGPEPGAVDFERRELVFARANLRAHFGQRPHDALHRPAGERLVPEDAGEEGLGGQDSAQHTDGGARIAGVEIGGGRAQSVESFALDPHFRAVNLHLDAERAHAAQRGVAIGARGVVVDARFPSAMAEIMA